MTEQRRRAVMRIAMAIGLMMAAAAALPALAQTPAPTPPEASAAAAKGVRLIDEIAQALARAAGYLEYYDQIQRMEVAQGRLGAAEADARLRQRAGEIYDNDFTDADLGAVIEQHRQSTAAYLDRIAGDLAASQLLPAGKADYYRSLGTLRLARLRQEYETLIGGQLDPRAILEAAAEVDGWSKGYDALPPAENPFAGEEARIAAAIPSPMMQAMLSVDPNAVLAQPLPPGVAAPAPAAPAPSAGWPAPPPPPAAAPAAPPVANPPAAPAAAVVPPTPKPAPPAPAAVVAPPAPKPPPAPRYTEIQRISQAEARDPATGRITVEASTIHVIRCGRSATAQPIYVYEYVNRRAFRAIQPPQWGSPLGGRDFTTFAQAVAAGCRAAAGH
jgi:hypothetical protein